jgi:phosphate starvation-inducible PhoH-like protein
VRGALRGRGPAARPPGSDEAVEVPLTFDDNRLASLVFGQYDQNVAHIERRLEVTATALGNHLVLKGPADAVETAQRVFQKLYARVRTGGSTLTPAAR